MMKGSYKIILLLAMLLACYPTTAFCGPATYQYDSLNRLIRSVNANGTVTTYEYDAEGNRTRIVRSTGNLTPPQAAFSADPVEGDAPLQVRFTDQSAGIVEAWHWDFGDGQASDEQHPVHTYSTPGTYTVTLTASNRNSQNTFSRAAYIIVQSPVGLRPGVSIAHGFSLGYNGTIDFNGDLKVGFRVTLENSGEEDAVVDASVDLAQGAFSIVVLPQNCIYDAVTKTFENIQVPAKGKFEIDYIAQYQGNKTANGDQVGNTASIRRIIGWYDSASGQDRGGYANLSATAACTVTAQSMMLGTIRDMSTEKVIYSAMITATGGKNTATDTKGFYRLVLSPGVYTVSISKSGYQTASLSPVIVYSNRATVLNVDLTTPGELAVATTSISDGLVGSEQNPKIKVSGGVYPYTYSLVSGKLPPGVLLDTATGNLSGTPTSAGSFTFTIRVRDKNGTYVERQFTQRIGEVLGFQTGFNLPRGTKGVAYSGNVLAVGGTPPYTYTLASGALPLSLNLASDGKISGMPDNVGQHYFTAKVDDTAGGTALRDFTLGVDDPLKVVTERLLSGIVGAAFKQDLEASGGYGATSWSVSAGTLPPGILLQAGGLAGTPEMPGSGKVTLQVSDEIGRVVQKEFAWEVGDPLDLTTQSLRDAYKGRAYAEALKVSGGVGKFAFSCLSSLPPGLSLHPDTGIISGSASIVGLSNVVVQVADQAYPDNQVSERTFSLRVVEPPVIKGDVSGDGEVTIADAVLVLQLLCGMTPSEPIQLEAAIGGKISTGDATYILQQVAGMGGEE
jgi:YD repeat-containing protein